VTHKSEDDEREIDDYEEEYYRGDDSKFGSYNLDQLHGLSGPFKKNDTRQQKRDERQKTGLSTRTDTKFQPKRDDKGDNKNPEFNRKGCWNMLTTGKCEGGDKCRFSHRPEDLRRSFQVFADLVRQNEGKYGPHSGRKPGGEHASSSD
jgi:hypothetical protein